MQKLAIIFLSRRMTIYTAIESSGRVDEKYVVLKMFITFSGPKKAKNSE
jgi:hypothetical protein